MLCLLFVDSHEALRDLIALLASLQDSKGNILVPGLNELVKELTPEEEALYRPIDFNVVSTFLPWVGISHQRIIIIDLFYVLCKFFFKTHNNVKSMLVKPHRKKCQIFDVNALK